MKSDVKNTDNVMQMLGYLTPLSAQFQERMTSQLLTETFPSHHLLLRPGEIARRIYYIKEGFLRAFTVDANGKQCTSWFMSKNDVMISVYSFFTQKPAEEYIEVLKDCVLQSLTWNQLQSYYADFKEGNFIGRVVTESYYIQAEERSIFMRTKTPEERYKILIDRYDGIEQLTTQTNIASYLGITRETLYRIKNKVMKPSDRD